MIFCYRDDATYTAEMALVIMRKKFELEPLFQKWHRNWDCTLNFLFALAVA